MQVDLERKVTRFVVQEYVNAIVNFKSQTELDFDVHKLIHTFEVVDVAHKLIDLTNPKLPKKLQNQIINAAILHDIGRCHEFEKGQLKKNFDHGQDGYLWIKKYFPHLIVEGTSTQWHNKCPSESDPLAAQPVLNYVRDADMLGNLIYEIKKMPVFMDHILKLFKERPTGLTLDNEIVQAALQNRSCCRSQMKKCDFLDMILSQLLWIYNLRTQAGFTFAKKEKIFPRCRDIIVSHVLPVIQGSEKQKKQLETQIKQLFPDEMFLKEFEKHGI